MAQTVIGMFESSSKAQEAVQELVESGISRDRIDVSGSSNSGSDLSGNSYSGSDLSGSSNSGSSYSDSGSSYSSSGSGRNSDEHESGISKFFKSLFGGDDDNDDADKYTRVASQAQSIVTVHAQSRDEAERVADILDDNGAVDVDEHASRMGYSGSGSGTGNYSGSGADVTSGGDYSGTGTGVSGMGAGAAGAGVTGLGADLTGTGSGVTGGAGYTGTGMGTGVTTGTSADLSNTGDTDYTDRTTDRTMNTDTDRTMNTGTGDQTRIPIIEENLEVGKREVRTGGVRLRSRIIERPVEEAVRLREERVNVERTTVDRPATAADFSNFQEREIEMVEHAEVPIVNKEARVVEEVSIDKDVQERTETIQETVRKTEVDVENLENNDLTRNRSGNSNL